MFKCLFFLIFPLFVAPLLPQPQPLTQSPPLKIVFPLDGDTLDFAKIRIAGSTDPEAMVVVQRQKLSVYPSGAFVGMVNLDYGWNLIIFHVSDQFATFLDTVNVFRPPLKPRFPISPTAIDQSSVVPASDLMLHPGDEFLVAFRGSPAGEAVCSLSGYRATFAMKELSSGKGVYRAKVKLPDNWLNRSIVSIVVNFKGNDNRAFQFEAPGKVSILSEMEPLIAVTMDSVNSILKKPNSPVYMELPQGVRAQILSQMDGFSRIRLSRNHEYYIKSASLAILPDTHEYPYAAISSVKTDTASEWINVRVKISAKAPFRVMQSIGKKYIEVSFFRALRANRFEPEWNQFHPLKKISFRQENGDLVKLRIVLNQKQQWGYKAGYIGDEFLLSIRKEPIFSVDSEHLLTGLRVAVDAGHGGEAMGVVSATDLAEKDVNLHFAYLVKELLEEKGAVVVMLRSDDVAMSLIERVKNARQKEAHLFLSLHNNSINPNVDPMRPRGTAVYYSHPQAKPLSDLIYKNMCKTGLRPFGRRYSPFVVTRQTDMIACLVEGAFLTHPEDEMLLLNHSFMKQMADAVVRGVLQFIEKQRSEQSDLRAEIGSFPEGAAVERGAVTR